MMLSIEETSSQARSAIDWLIKEEFSIFGKKEREILTDKTRLLGKSQHLAEQAKAILLSEVADTAVPGSKFEPNAKIPVLSPPKRAYDFFRPNELLEQLTTLTSEMDLQELFVKLQAATSSYDNCRQEAIAGGERIKRTLDKTEQFGKQASTAQRILEGLKKEENKLQQEKTEKEKALLGLDKKSAEYTKITMEIKQIDEQEGKCRTELQNQKEIITEQIGLATKALTDIDQALEKQKNLPEPLKEATDTAHRTNSARLAELITFFMRLINKNSELALRSQLSVFEAMQKSLHENMEKKADEIAAQEQKAADLQKTMGCLGKIIGAVVTAVSVISAAFTGGASLALAGIGVALMVGDSILESITGESITEYIMTPFMEHVFLPLIKAVGSVTDNILEYTPLGQLLKLIGELTGSDIIGMVKSTMAAMISLAILVSVSYLVKSAGGFLAKKLFGTTLEQLFKTLVPKILVAAVKQASDKVVGSYSKVAAKLGIKAQATARRALQLQKLSQYANYGNLSAQATANIVVADFREKATKVMASFKVSQAEQESIKQVLQSVMEEFEHSQSIYRNLAKLIADAQHNEFESGKIIVTNMRI